MIEIILILQFVLTIFIFYWFRKKLEINKNYIVKKITSDVKTKVLRDSRITAKKEYNQIESYISLVMEIKPRNILPTTRKWAGSPDFLKYLYTFIQDNKPNTIVELGSGVSSLVCGYSLEKNNRGKCFSIDHEGFFADKSRKMIIDHELDKFVEVRHAPLEANLFGNDEYNWYQLQQFKDIEYIDLLIVDGPPASTGNKARNPAVYALLDKIDENTVILLDDGIREDEKTIAEEWSKLLGKDAIYFDFEKGMFKLQ